MVAPRWSTFGLTTESSPMQIPCPSTTFVELVSVVEDPATDLVLGDESEDFHLGIEP